jgi:hypothetical protein
MDLNAAEGLAWEVRGLLSFIGLIAWCRWRGPPDDQKRIEAIKVPKRRERKQETVDQSVGSALPSISRARSLRPMARSSRSANVSPVR